MQLIAAACDVANAVGSACLHTTPAPGTPTLDQWGTSLHDAVRGMFGAYLDMGPIAWLVGFVLVVWLGKTLVSIPLGMVLFIFKGRSSE
jgi:hypothetical protein